MRVIALAVLLLASLAVSAGEANVAVAANFAAPAKLLAQRFQRDSGHRIALSSGSTGKFYAQIRNGAPLDVLLAADSEVPQRLARERLAVAGSRFTYAVGKLALWSPNADLVDARAEVLRKASFKRLAIASPQLAPYGAAAQETMQKLGVWAALQSRLVQGESIAQAFQFVASGNADLGFVALSQLHDGSGAMLGGSFWVVPEGLHAPLEQDAVLLAHGARNEAARHFLEFLRSAPARELIRAFGYQVP